MAISQLPIEQWSSIIKLLIPPDYRVSVNRRGLENDVKITMWVDDRCAEYVVSNEMIELGVNQLIRTIAEQMVRRLQQVVPMSTDNSTFMSTSPEIKDCVAEIEAQAAVYVTVETSALQYSIRITSKWTGGEYTNAIPGFVTNVRTDVEHYIEQLNVRIANTGRN